MSFVEPREIEVSKFFEYGLCGEHWNIECMDCGQISSIDSVLADTWVKINYGIIDEHPISRVTFQTLGITCGIF